MTAEELSIIEQSAIAEDNRDRILACRANLQANFLVLAKLLKDNRDKSLWKLLSYESFESFLGSPEIGFSRSRAYGLIQLYEKFVEKLGIPAEDIIEIGNSKLLMIVGRVDENVEEWLAKAKSLSKSDLRLEIDGQGPGEIKLSPPPLAPAPSPRMTPEAYLKIVKHSPCINCGRSDTIVQAHFPRTRVRAEHPWHVIPLCPACHAEQEGSMEWCWKYRGNWAKWFYGLIAGE